MSPARPTVIQQVAPRAFRVDVPAAFPADGSHWDGVALQQALARLQASGGRQS